MNIKIISATDNVLVGSKMFFDPASAFFEHGNIQFKVQKVEVQGTIIKISCFNFYITGKNLGE